MNIATSKSQPVENQLINIQGDAAAKTAYVEDADKSALKHAFEEARLQRKDQALSQEKAKAKQSATLRMVRSGQIAGLSKKEQAALEIARALGLSSAQCKALLKEASTSEVAGKLAETLENQTPETLAKELNNNPQAKALLEKVTKALNSSDPLGALGVSKEAVATFVTEANFVNNDQDTGSDFAKAAGAAMGMIQVLIGKSAETAALLAKFAETFEALKALEASNTINKMQGLQAHYDHEMHKMHALGILKKIFGAIIAAILAAIGAITGNLGLIAVAAVLVTVTFVPKAMDTICEGLARDVLHLKGKAAESFALYMRIMIALLLTIASGGAGGASMVSNVLSTVGTFAGSFMMAGGAENVANLTVDLKDNCDVYSGDATDSEKADASNVEEITSYVLMAVGFTGLAGGGVANYFSGASEVGTESGAATTRAINRAAQNGGPVVEGGEGAENTAETVEEIVEDSTSASDSEESAKTKADAAKAARKAKFLKIARYGFAGTSAGDGTADVLIGQAMIAMAGIVRDLIITQSSLSLSEASLKVQTKQMQRDAASDQATTSQGINEMKNITLDEAMAYQHQIVGATAV